MKFVVPSSGSTIQVGAPESSFEYPDSSASTRCDGKRARHRLENRLLRGQIGRRNQVVARLLVDLIGRKGPPKGHQLRAAQPGDGLDFAEKGFRIRK